MKHQLLSLKNTNGTETVYREFGDPANKAIVLLHGIGADHMMWQPQFEEFAANGFYVLAPDLLGHGKSSDMERPELAEWEAQINDLLKAKRKERCILIGVSMGGVIAQSFTIHHPDAVSRLILCDTFGELKTVTEKFLGLSQVIGFKLYKILGGQMLSKGMAATYKAPFAEQARAYFTQMSREANFNQLILARKAINRIDALEALKGVNIPALIMVGDQFGSSFVNINRKIADAVAGSRFVVLPEAMDPSNLVNPLKFNQEVLTFLEELS